MFRGPVILGTSWLPSRCDLLFRAIVLGTILNAAFIFGFFYTPAINSSQPSRQSTVNQGTQDRPAKTDKDQQDESFRQWVTHDAAGFFTLWLVIVGVSQLVLFWVQLLFIRESLDDAKIAAGAAKDGAKAAQDSAYIAKLSMVAGDRAYVHFNGCRWVSHSDINDGHIFWRIRPMWINSGNTPTRQLRIYVHYEFRDDELPSDYAFIPDSTITVVPTTIAPKSVVESGHRDFHGKNLVAVSEGKKHLYIWGIARYRDVFPDTIEHITKFCVEARTVTGNPLESWTAQLNPVEVMFASYVRHNCADEDCEDQS
jgi:hypothetical protein